MRSKKFNSYTAPRTTCISYHWTNDVEKLVKSMVVGKCLHVCSGRSAIGDVRLDIMIWKKHRKSFSEANMLGDADKIPFRDSCFDTVVTDPIYNKLEPPFIDEIVRVLRNGGKLIYFYPGVPYHPALNLGKLFVYPNQHLKYYRFLSTFNVSKLEL